MTARLAQEISYASSIPGRPGRLFVRTLENLTGRRDLIRRAQGYEAELAGGRPFWEVIAARYGLRLELTGHALESIPKQGPLVIVSNHPYGVLDGLMMGQILSRVRGSGFRILAHQVFRKAPELEDVILPIDFSQTQAAARANIATRRAALDHLAGGGAIGVFPGGTVATPKRPFGPPMDPAWRLFTARMVARSGAAVVPVFFEGHNSRLFHLASHVSYALRMGLLIKEFRARVDTPVKLRIGATLRPDRLAPYAGDPQRLINFLREQTFALSPDPLNWRETGYEFEPRYRQIEDAFA